MVSGPDLLRDSDMFHPVPLSVGNAVRLRRRLIGLGAVMAISIAFAVAGPHRMAEGLVSAVGLGPTAKATTSGHPTYWTSSPA